MSEAISENVGTKLLFENDRVRVWDLALAPGESLPKHIHHNDFLFVVAASGDLRHVDPDNTANNTDVRYEDGQVVFIEAGDGIVHHRLDNMGTTPYRNFVIELKSPAVAPDL